MVRLVKGAYWDAEIKRAQVDGLDGYPVYTRKVYTDPHRKIALPRNLYGADRFNSLGMDLANEHVLQQLNTALIVDAQEQRHVAPMLAATPASAGDALKVLNPADHQDVVGTVQEASAADVELALQQAVLAAPQWAATAPAERAACLERMADLMEANMATLMGLAVRESGKTLPNAIAEVREAVDFCRYYAAQVRSEFNNQTHPALGPVVCISPWNFPLATWCWPSLPSKPR
uniref:Aldehyde dehydrogenase domain-containing protein n=1 Tax=Hucho hucho TaxID=62062 RepID=A0A4W5LG22_9TELE